MASMIVVRAANRTRCVQKCFSGEKKNNNFHLCGSVLGLGRHVILEKETLTAPNVLVNQQSCSRKLWGKESAQRGATCI